MGLLTDLSDPRSALSRRVVVEINLVGPDNLAVAIMPACAANMVRKAKLAAIGALGATGWHERIVRTPHTAFRARLTVLLDSHDLTFRRPALPGGSGQRRSLRRFPGTGRHSCGPA